MKTIKVEEGNYKLPIDVKVTLEQLATSFYEDYHEQNNDKAKHQYMAMWELCERLGASIPDLID